MVFELVLASSFAQSLSVAGPACPGPMDVTVSGVTPGGQFALVTGTLGGQTMIPAGAPCAGTMLQVGQAVSRLVTQADASGNRFIPAAGVPQGMCTQAAQVIDASTCTISAAVPVFSAVQVVAGYLHSCALFGGRVKCWGLNQEGELGLGDNVDRGGGPNEMGANLPYVSLGAGRTPVALAAGWTHTCALFDDGAVKCWGDNGSGQLGVGDSSDRGDGPNEMGANLPVVSLGAGRSAVALALGAEHSCALLDNGTIKCWGDNGSGQLGLGDTSSRGNGPNEMGANLSTVALGQGRTATALAAGGDETCALLDDGTVKCWGRNVYGQLGLGDTSNRGDAANEMGSNLPPVDVGAGRTVTAVTVGYEHTCALLDDGTTKCWGRNLYGQLGLGDTANRGDDRIEMGPNLPAVDLGAGRTATALVAGGSSHTCALLDNMTMKCWGRGNNGALGLGSVSDRGDGPNEMGNNLPGVDLGVGRTATIVSVGPNSHNCAGLDDQSIKCWGHNSFGQLGLGDTADRGDGAGEMGNSLPTVTLF